MKDVRYSFATIWRRRYGIINVWWVNLLGMNFLTVPFDNKTQAELIIYDFIKYEIDITEDSFLE